MYESSIVLFLALLALGAVCAVAFVGGTYLHARRFTRGTFGWPGFRYFLHETLCTSLTQALWPIGWFIGDGFGARVGRAGRPIVLIHGWTQNRTNFFWLSRFLRKKGLGPFYGFNYFSFQPIERSAESLAAFVERVMAHTGAQQIDLVCHSLGGLVARTYVDLMDGHRHVHRVVTLGTPHCGIAYANPILGPGIRDMHAETGFVVQLAAAPLPPKVRYLSIYSMHDNIVFPGSVSCLGERGEDVVVSGFGHFGILFCEQVGEHVYQALAGGSRAERGARLPADPLPSRELV